MLAPPRILAAAVGFGLALAALPGCGDAPHGRGPADSTLFAPISPQQATGELGRDYVLVISLRMISYELPMGAGDDPAVWRHVDESSLNDRSAGRLARNGIRLGVGDIENAEDVAQALRELISQGNRQTTLTVLPGQPATMELQRSFTRRTIFIRRDDQHISGADYPPGDLILSLLCTLNSEDPTAVHVAAVPQVRTSRRRPQITIDASEAAITHRPTYHPLAELGFQVVVPSGGFVLLAPREAGAASAGSAMLRHDHHDVMVDVVHMITAEVFVSPLRSPHHHDIDGAFSQPAPR